MRRDKGTHELSPCYNACCALPWVAGMPQAVSRAGAHLACLGQPGHRRDAGLPSTANLALMSVVWFARGRHAVCHACCSDGRDPGMVVYKESPAASCAQRPQITRVFTKTGLCHPQLGLACDDISASHLPPASRLSTRACLSQRWRIRQLKCQVRAQDSTLAPLQQHPALNAPPQNGQHATGSLRLPK